MLRTNSSIAKEIWEGTLIRVEALIMANAVYKHDKRLSGSLLIAFSVFSCLSVSSTMALKSEHRDLIFKRPNYELTLNVLRPRNFLHFGS